MAYNFRGQDEVKVGCIGYLHGGLDIKPLILEGLHVEKRWRRLSISYVDVTVVTS